MNRSTIWPDLAMVLHDFVLLSALPDFVCGSVLPVIICPGTQFDLDYRTSRSFVHNVHKVN